MGQSTKLCCRQEISIDCCTAHSSAAVQCLCHVVSVRSITDTDLLHLVFKIHLIITIWQQLSNVLLLIFLWLTYHKPHDGHSKCASHSKNRKCFKSFTLIHKTSSASGDPQTHYRGSAPGPRYRTLVPQNPCIAGPAIPKAPDQTPPMNPLLGKRNRSQFI